MLIKTKITIAYFQVIYHSKERIKSNLFKIDSLLWSLIIFSPSDVCHVSFNILKLIEIDFLIVFLFE